MTNQQPTNLSHPDLDEQLEEYRGYRDVIEAERQEEEEKIKALQQLIELKRSSLNFLISQVDLWNGRIKSLENKMAAIGGKGESN